MSWQADHFKVKSVGLVLPKGFKIEEFIKRETGHDYGMRIVVESDLVHWSFNEGREGLSPEGVVTDRGLEVTKLECSGEGSGHDYDDILKPLFEKFKGSLEATIIWDSGEAMKVKIENGEVTETKADL